MRSGTLVGIAFVYGYFGGHNPAFLGWAVACAILTVTLDIVLEHRTRG